RAFLVRDASALENLFSNEFGGDKWGTNAIQRMLTSLGYDPGTCDGKMGPKTQAAVKQFQTDNGLSADGDPGPDTRGKLFPLYMDAVCQDASGAPFTLTAQSFLAQ